MASLFWKKNNERFLINESLYHYWSLLQEKCWTSSPCVPWHLLCHLQQAFLLTLITFLSVFCWHLSNSPANGKHHSDFFQVISTRHTCSTEPLSKKVLIRCTNCAQILKKHCTCFVPIQTKDSSHNPHTCITQQWSRNEVIINSIIINCINTSF